MTIISFTNDKIASADRPRPVYSVSLAICDDNICNEIKLSSLRNKDE